MADETHDPTHSADQPQDSARPDVTRRDFVAMSLAAGLVAATGSTAEGALPVSEKMVEIKTPDGTCEAAYIAPTSGTHPAVIIWPDAFGLRASLREMGKQLAAEGYTVLIPNPFYRVSKMPIEGLDPTKFSFTNQADRARLGPLMGSIGAPGAAEKDAAAFVAFLDAQPQVNKSKKIGTQGYCMGGPLVFRTMASQSARVGAGASFHGGGLVTNNPGSPHTLVPQMKGRMYVGVASNDDAQQPDAKDKLREAFAAVKMPAEIEVYPSLHGWCMSDMPAGDGKPIYNKADAEKAWTKLLALYKTALA